MRGSSLSGLVEPGARVEVLEGYARCNNLSRGDLVLYHYAGDDVPLIKIVKAVPGDRWHLDGCHIVVNNETLATKAADGGEGEQYCISDTRRLQLYTHDYPVIPAHTYLILGNVPSGSLDGSYFGLVDSGDILGLATLARS